MNQLVSDPIKLLKKPNFMIADIRDSRNFIKVMNTTKNCLTGTSALEFNVHPTPEDPNKEKKKLLGVSTDTVSNKFRAFVYSSNVNICFIMKL